MSNENRPGANPAALRYQEQLKARRQGGDSTERGTLLPRMDDPRLDAAKTLPNLSIAEVARELGSNIGRTHPPARNPVHEMGLRPMDMLPEQVQQDPEYISGSGSMMAVSQPHLAKKYGVIRQGRFIPPQSLNSRPEEEGGEKKYNPETTEGLKALLAYNELPKGEPGKPAMAADLGDKDMTAAAKGLDTPKKGDPERKINLDQLDSYEVNKIIEQMSQNPLKTEEQRKIIASRVKPLGMDDIGDLVVRGFVVQKVPIHPGKLEVEFRSVQGEVDLALKKMLALESRQLEVNDRYYLDKYSMMSVCASIESINGKKYPTCFNEDNRFDEDLFLKKLKFFLNLDFFLIVSLSIHFGWFMDRVRDLYVMENVKNG